MAQGKELEKRYAHAASGRGLPILLLQHERQEPAHVHVEKGAGQAKLWLQPVELTYSHGLTLAELRRVRQLTFEHQAEFLERWNEHFHS